MKDLGFKITIIKKRQAPPLIVAFPSFNGDKNRLTIGIYGHYDVQPADPIDRWENSPFDLVLKKGKFFGRGIADNKGHIIQNLTAVSYLIREKKLRNNIIFILEGEEETGSIHFEEMIKKAKKYFMKS